METTKLYEIFLQNPFVQTDTRKINPGDLFFALKGPQFNGNFYAQEALEKGASYVIVDEQEFAREERAILVPDVLKALQELAAFHRMQFSIPFLAITGSNGKTTSKELVTQCLKTRYKTVATQGNLNNHIGIPLTLLSIPLDTEIAVIEMGANHQKEIEQYCSMVQPTHGIITNCGKAHIEGFGGEEGVRKGKGELYDYLREHKGTIFRNADLPYLEEMARGIANQVSYGSANAHYIGKPLQNGLFLRLAVLKSGSETSLKTQLVGDYNFPNVMLAVAVGLHFGIPIIDIKQSIESYNPDNSRSQFIEMGSNRIILDAYNANPSSMSAAIINFANSEAPSKTLWLGAMKEMGPYEEQEHRELISLIQKYNWAEVILVGREFKNLPHSYRWFESSEDALDYLMLHKPEQASILIKGSRGSKMEKMAEVFGI